MYIRLFSGKPFTFSDNFFLSFRTEVIRPGKLPYNFHQAVRYRSRSISRRADTVRSSGRSSGSSRSQTLPVTYISQWFTMFCETSRGNTAAGTVAGSHGVPS